MLPSTSAYLGQKVVRILEIFQENGDLAVIGRPFGGHAPELPLHALHRGGWRELWESMWGAQLGAAQNGSPN